ncbi:hypothetical protein MLD38_019122 [Melastoma candidum]|uniref:Uncharacterized protein n=1 Tax=Melastoma candidum TaxID=119954 RepID=A0ACB9QVX7_9MYRT|nr:hypothetical protein MLD38_019122 [Melastoma candidum]
MASIHFLLLTAAAVLLSFPSLSSPLGFNCTSAMATATFCRSLVSFTPTSNNATLSSIQLLFGIKHLVPLLSTNNLPATTPLNATLDPSHPILVPLNCSCSRSHHTGLALGISYKGPIYKVRSGDTLYDIANGVFAGLVTVGDLQTVNGIANASLIKVGDRLWVPLPCSCDEVEGQDAVHLAHVTSSGSSVEEIAGEYGVAQSTVMAVNGIGDPRALRAGQVLDVPLRACASSIRNDSLDSRLLVPNGTYAVTANNCVTCSCHAINNWMLQCWPSQTIKPSNWTVCPSMSCQGTGLYVGNTTSSSCNRTTCAYAGYDRQSIFTTIVNEGTCPVSGNFAGRMSSPILTRILLLVSLWLLNLHPTLEGIKECC